MDPGKIPGRNVRNAVVSRSSEVQQLQEERDMSIQAAYWRDIVTYVTDSEVAQAYGAQQAQHSARKSHREAR